MPRQFSQAQGSVNGSTAETAGASLFKFMFSKSTFLHQTLEEAVLLLPFSSYASPLHRLC